jgi:alkylation response protein AidB-like acyl-CoA dehydrogenase
MTIAEFPALLDKARVLADQFALSASHYDETGNFPFVNFDQLFEVDLLRLTSSRENGGLGGGLTEAQAIVAEIARGEPSTALVLAMHYSHHNAISRGGKWPRHLVDRVSAANLAGPALINSAQVEPRVGSPSHGSLPETVARRNGDVWRISGHKNYATGIPGLKYINVLAVTDEPTPRLASFLVPKDAKGVHIVETWNATGMRATSSHDIILDEVEVPLEDITDSSVASEGLKRDETGSAWYFLLIASVYHGVARAAGNWILDFAASYAPGSLGQPIATVPRIQDGLGEIEYRLAVNERLLRTTAEDADARRPVGLQPAFAKHQVIENAVAVTTLALDLGGNPGLKRNHPLERHHRDALCGRAHAPQNNMIRTMAAKAALARRAGVSPADAAKAASQPTANKPKLSIVGG